MGGYYRDSDVTDASLMNVRLPEKIRCSTCNKYKAPNNFAKKRLNELREKIKNKKGPITAQCTLCTPQQVMELRCYMCGKVKGLDDFAKAQRKNPDKAKCNPCMKEQLEFEAIEDKRTYHGVSMSDSDDDDDDSDSDPECYSFDDSESNFPVSGGGGSITGNLIGHFDDLSVSDSASTTTGGYWSPANDRSAAGGSKASAAGNDNGARALSYAASLSSTSAAKTDGSSSWASGFDPMKYGHPRGSSVADSMETNRPASSKSSGWAKVKAFKAEPEPKPKDEEAWGDVDEEEDSSSDDDESDDEY
ncbi:hypothetical protein SLS55_006359 [Diplodia seriata]|uniref:Stc1 domain-containing protein n=1 Tax=Diplodia seriata TaxID=420778 RepID=A0ABR3CF91_9PEZI